METLIHQTRFSVRIVTIDFYLCPLEEVAAFGKAYANINVQPSQSQSTSGDCFVPGASQQQSPGLAEASPAFHYSVNPHKSSYCTYIWFYPGWTKSLCAYSWGFPVYLHPTIQRKAGVDSGTHR